MASIQARSESHASSVGHAEYSGDVSSRHGRATHVSGRKLRFAYFGIASVWGFIVGVGGTLAALQADGKLAAPPGTGLLVYVAPCLLIALVGSGVIAGSYQEARRRK
jgi:hypothetical protein